MSKNAFSSTSVESWFHWIWRKHDDLPAVTIYFLSNKNSTSARFFSLYDRTEKFRVILIKGFRLPYMDRMSLMFLQLFSRLMENKLNNYEWVSLNNYQMLLRIKTNILLNVDDPVYSITEKENLVSLYQKQKEIGKKLVVVVTNSFTENYFSSFLPKTVLKVLSQGYIEQKNEHIKNKFTKFSLVYSSPYIDYVGDKHEEHESWSAVHLIDALIPEIFKMNPEIEIHLIGRVGSNATKELSKFSNVKFHGLCSIEKSNQIMNKCHLGIYPRNHDSQRSVMKIFDYIGNDLPVVTYDLIDTRLIKEMNFGISVSNVDEFGKAVYKLVSDQKYYALICKNIVDNKGVYSWNRLARVYDSFVDTK